MSFFINPNVIDGYTKTTAPTVPVRRDLPRYRQKSSPNPLTDLFNRISADSRRKSVQVAKSAPAEAAPVRRRYTMKAVGTAAKAAVRMQRIGREVGIARQVERRERAGNNFARMSAGLVVRDNLMNVRATLVATSAENTSRLAEIDQELASIKADKTENREVKRQLVIKGIIGGDLVGVFWRKEDELRQSSKELKREAAVIRSEQSVVEGQIQSLDGRLADMAVATERPFNGGGKPDLARARGEREVVVERTRVMTPDVEEESVIAPVVVHPPMVKRAPVKHKPLPFQEAVPNAGDAGTIAPASTFKGRSSISPTTKQRLSAYLTTVNKRPGLWLMGKKKVMAAEAKDLAAEMDFVTWMDTVRSDAGARTSFKGISGNKAKSNVMFTQLQKVVQREDGTYEGGVERTHSPADRRASVEYFAKEHNLDPTRLDNLMRDVSSADKKTRVARTRALTDYMIG